MNRTRRLIAVTALLAIATAGCAKADKPAWSFDTSAGAPGGGNTVASVSTPAPAATAAAASSPSGDVLGTLEITAVDLGFEPKAIEVDAAGRYEVTLKNTGSILHDLTFADGTVISANAGQSETGVVDVPAEGIDFICSIPGHRTPG